MEALLLRRDGALKLAFLFALVLLIRIPFLNQAVQGDDVYYLAGAEHAQIDPLHPNHLQYIFLGDAVDMRGYPHPPFNAWFLGTLLALTGDIGEIPYHAAYILFSLIAVASMWSLARRFSPHPVYATMLFLAVPVFVVNGNSLESDLPFLAWWMAGVALMAAGGTWSAAPVLALAALSAYQAVFLTPVLAAYVWLFRRRDRAAWLVTFVPLLTLGAWQLFEHISSGVLPADVMSSNFRAYGLQELPRKLRSAAALAVHFCFLVFPALLPPAAVLAWRKRNDRETQFLAAWIAIFFAGAVAVFFAGSARYLLPLAAPVALLVSRLGPRWLTIGFAAQLSLGLGLAATNYMHWDGYRRFAASLAPELRVRRVWINGEWGLRYYFEAEGGLPLRKGQTMRPGDLVVTSELGSGVDFTQPTASLRQEEIRPWVPLRLIGLESRSGYSTAERGLLPFGISRGVIDRVRAELVIERRPAREYLTMNAPEAREQLVSGVYALEDGRWRWMGRRAVALLKSPARALPIAVSFAIPGASPVRGLRVLLDDTEVARQTYPGPGTYELQTAPVSPRAAAATVIIEADQVFSVAGDRRELSVILLALGFRQP